MTVRDATPDDFEAYLRLFGELGVDDPLPSRAAWVATDQPTTLVAEREGVVVGCAALRFLGEVGHLRVLATAPSHRRTGVGRALLAASRARFRAAGVTEWQLNVKADNHGAIALYESEGFRCAHPTTVVRLPWSAADGLPRDAALVTRIATAPDDASVERALGLSPGQLAAGRALGRCLVVAWRDAVPVGVAVFDPAFPGALPFRARAAEAAAALVDALALLRTALPADATPAWRHDAVQLAVEAAPDVAAALVSAGAAVVFEILNLRAPTAESPRAAEA